MSLHHSYFMKLYEKPPSSLFKDLNEVVDDFYYLIAIGFTQVYPLLFPYLKLSMFFGPKSMALAP